MSDTQEPLFPVEPQTLVSSDKPTHSIGLTIMVANPTDWREVFDLVSNVMRDLPKQYAGIHVSSYTIDAEPVDDYSDSSEYYDENTLRKAYDAMGRVLPTLTMTQKTDLVNEFNNVGLLFRERR